MNETWSLPLKTHSILRKTEKKGFPLNLRSGIIKVCVRGCGITDKEADKVIRVHVMYCLAEKKNCCLDLILELKYQ